MNPPTSLSSYNRPAKRQHQISHNTNDNNKTQNHQQQSSNSTTIKTKIIHTPSSLTTEFIKLINYNNALTTPALKLLNLYFCLWECYVIKSTKKIQLEKKQQQLQESNK
ncbi:unnamed protein product [Penicillium salamii]|nr:unnamed protein product [Penicillium salamii]